MLRQVLETYERWYDEAEENKIDEMIPLVTHAPSRDDIDSIAAYLSVFVILSRDLVNQKYVDKWDAQELVSGNEALIDLVLECIEAKSFVKLRNLGKCTVHVHSTGSVGKSTRCLVIFKPTYGVRVHPDVFGRSGIIIDSDIQFVKEDLATNNAELFPADPIDLGDNQTPNTPIPADIQALQDGLSRLRVYSETTPSEDRDLPRDRYKEQFALMFQSTDVENSITVHDEREYISLFRIHHVFLPDLARAAGRMTPALKAQTFCNTFIYPTVLYPITGFDALSFKEETLWRFPLFFRVRTARTWKKYIPKTDWTVMIGGLLPLIISDISTQKAGSDHLQLLLEAVALSRVGNYFIKPTSDKTFFATVLYLSENLEVHRYIVKPENRDIKAKVNIVKKVFDLKQPNASTLFLQEMYNLLTEIQSLAKDFDLQKTGDLAAVAEEASSVTSFEFRSPSVEEDEENEEDNSWRFDSEEVRYVLDRHDYEVGSVDDSHRNIAFVRKRGTDDVVEILKFVGKDSNELLILYHMSTVESPHNHVIRLIRIWSVEGGTMLSLPLAGKCISDLPDISDNLLWDITYQLFKGIELLHEQDIAHLNLNPQNILISETDNRLTLIDFEVSVQLKNRSVQGVVGTKGYRAPEIKTLEWFSPQLADLYSCGVIVKELCDKAEDSALRTALLDIAASLIDSNPQKRLKMAEVSQRVENIQR